MSRRRRRTHFFSRKSTEKALKKSRQAEMTQLHRSEIPISLKAEREGADRNPDHFPKVQGNEKKQRGRNFYITHGHVYTDDLAARER